MKKITSQIFLIVSIGLISFLGVSVFNGYLDMHGYYETIIGDRNNWNIMIRGIVAAIVPTLYLLLRKEGSLRGFFLSLLGGVVLYMRLVIGLSTKMVGFGAIRLAFNALLIFGLGSGFIALTTVLGGWLKYKILDLKTHSIIDLILNFGVGLSLFAILQIVLMMATIYYPIVVWLMVIGLLVGLYYAKEMRKETATIAQDFVRSLQWSSLSLPRWAKWLVALLLVMSFWYIMNGYLMAYMPYSTAWDANHAYMFYPKMRALNGGLYWNEIGMQQTPNIRYGFLTFWFSLFQPFGGLFGIAPDTIAIEMNYFSGIYVLILGVALSSVVSKLIKKMNEHASSILGTMMGWLLTLTWLMSGMGAFLIFVDNKTDLGVMALIMLAMLSGFVFLHKLYEKKHALKYIGLSGFFYGIAALAKATALFDVVNFGLFLRWIWFGVVGVIGITLLIMGSMTLISFRGIKEYIAPSIAKILALIGLGTTIGATVIAFLKKSKQYFVFLAVWLGVFLATVYIVKGPYVVIANMTYNTQRSPGDMMKRILLAQNGSAQPVECSLESLGLQSTDQLYDSLIDLEGSAYDEDVGRYVGFGWKGNLADQRRGVQPYFNPWWAAGLDVGCYGFTLLGGDSSNAKILCDTQEEWFEYDEQGLLSVRNQLDTESPEYELVDSLYQSIKDDTSVSVDELRGKYSNQMQSITKIMEDKTIRVMMDQGDKVVFFPYKYLIPLNITYNWSLQNESSYYTDIGIVWLILMVFAIVGLLYGLVTKQRYLAALSGVTVFGWILWWLIGGGIVRYAIGIIVWSIISFVGFIISLYDRRTTWKKDPILYGCFALFIGLFCLFTLRQQGFNMLRISFQTTRVGEMFNRYRMNAGIKESFNEKLQLTGKPTSQYSQKDVFDRQFSHYNGFIESANDSSDQEGSWIAGTYVRYFIENQTNVKYDQFIQWMGRMVSDDNSCATYLRLQDQGIRYMAIDPNIGTVVQGAGNKSLFYRFFGKTNPTNGSIESYGAITMFTKMVEEGYARLLTTNNLGAKYAQSLPDDVFQNIPEDQLISYKARMSVARYFGTRENNQYIDASLSIAKQRLTTGLFIEDMAWALGINPVRTNKLVGMIQSGAISGEDILELEQNEKKALEQFMYLRQVQAERPSELDGILRSVIMRTMYSPNQILVFELID